MRYLLSLNFLAAPVAAFAHNAPHDTALLPGLLHDVLSPHHLPIVIIVFLAIVFLVERVSRSRKF